MATKTTATRSRKSPVGQAEELTKEINGHLLAERDAQGVERSANVDKALDCVQRLARLLTAINARDSEIQKSFRAAFGLGPKR